MTKQQRARQERAAQRLQGASTTLILPGWNKTQVDKMMQRLLAEFCAHCKNGVISFTNVSDAAHNVMLGAHNTLNAQDYQYWLANFIRDGKEAALPALVQR